MQRIHGERQMRQYRRLRSGMAWPVLALACTGWMNACGGDDSSSSSTTPPPTTTPPTNTVFSCDTASLSQVKLDNASVTAATPVAAGGFTPPGANTALKGLPSF